MFFFLLNFDKFTLIPLFYPLICIKQADLSIYLAFDAVYPMFDAFKKL
jgi:hypothetical protein